MSIFQRKAPNHFIRINPNNATNKDWLIMLEAGTIVGPSPAKLRVARSTRERKVVKKYNLRLKPEYYLDVEGYDPRIHAVYFCPQLYKYDSEKKLVPLYGEEIGKLIAQALESSVQARRPWWICPGAPPPRISAAAMSRPMGERTTHVVLPTTTDGQWPGRIELKLWHPARATAACCL